MTANRMQSTPSMSTTDFKQGMARGHSENALRGAIHRSTFGFKPSLLPDQIRDYLRDCGRKEPRNTKPMGRYPEIAVDLASRGVSLSAILAPLTIVKARIMGAVARHFPSLEEIQHTETNANRDFDHCQLALADGSFTPSEIDAAIEAGNSQIITTETELAVLESLRHRSRK